MDSHLFEYLQKFITPKRLENFNKIILDRTRHFTVALEDVYQIHNTSAVMRSCDVFGVQDVHVIEQKLGKRVDKEIAMGAQKWVNLYRYNSTQNSIDSLKDEGYQIIATTPHVDATYLHQFDITKKSAFFFGKEKEGLTETVLLQADGFLKIPMYGFTESLNISVSAAIILQDLVTRLKQSKISWQLTDEEKETLLLKWIKNSIFIVGIFPNFEKWKHFIQVK